MNSAEQISFIFGNPLEYTGILLRFLRMYLSIDNANQYVNYLGYYGIIHYFSLCLIAVVVAICMEGNSKVGKITRVSKCMMAFCGFGTLCIVATALYVSFTPVGLSKINGCQWRYILPVVFPVMYALTENRLDSSKVNKGVVISVCMFMMAVVFVYGIGTGCIAHY